MMGMIGSTGAAELIRQKLSVKRYEHCLNVAQVAREMAELYGVDADKAYLTGLLHDYAKGLSGAQLLNLAKTNGLIDDPLEYEMPDLLHAPVGAWLLRQEGIISDNQMLQAISVHTLGDMNMTTLDKIIFLADMIEPGRDYPGMERLACLARRDLDRGMLYGLDTTIRYCLDQGRMLHPRTIAVRNVFLKGLKNKETDGL